MSNVHKLETNRFWFAVYEDVFDHEIVGAHVPTPKAADKERDAWMPILAWLWLCKEAAHRNRRRVIKGRLIDLRRGQLAVSERFLAQKLNWGRKATRLFLQKLERFGMVDLSVSGSKPQLALNFAEPQRDNADPKSGPALTVITICNYDKYQHGFTPKEPARDQLGTNKGPAGDQNPTSNRDTTDKRTLDHHQSALEQEKEKTRAENSIEDDDRLPKKVITIPAATRTALANQVGEEHADELIAEYVGSSYAQTADVPNRAFIGWLKRTYGIVISLRGSMTSVGDILATLPKDKFGRPDTTLPSAEKLARRRA